ncbi:MAG TPA: hypothetical protein VMK65_02640 [Longimicrobiales bacterium]|nr:hypothetical protein [Longimicrobiales bacterium]
MPRRITSRLTYAAERWLLKGMQYRLLLIALVIALLSILGGALVLAAGDFSRLGESTWWAFLRLTDPGYLGDDEGAFRRVVSTLLTVAGYVVFLGALVAVMTQWLNETMRDLEAGLTPIARRNHIVILGWTDHTPVLVRELVLSEARVRRFLSRRGARELHLALLVDQVGPHLIQELKDRLGRRWDESRVTLRSGTPLRVEHLSRVDFLNASVLLVPAGEFTREGSADLDARAIKTLLSISNHPLSRRAELPRAVVELRDRRKLGVARNAYAGPLEVVATNATVSRLIAQNVRHRGLSAVNNELLTHARGNEIYIREAGELAGRRLQDLLACYPRAIPLGVVRPHGRSFQPLLNPPDGFVLADGDRLALLARSWEDAGAKPGGEERLERGGGPLAAAPPAAARRILVLGWSRKVPELLREFTGDAREPVSIDLLSAVPLARRRRRLARWELPEDRIRLLEGDFTAAAELAALEPGGYDNIVLLASDWLRSGEESDARTLMGYLVLRELLGDAEDGPEILIELLDPANATLLRERPGEVLISPLVISHMLAQVALRPELRAVFDELFGPSGAELDFLPLERYGVTGEATFAEVQRAVSRAGETALGARLAGGRVELNPGRERRWSLGPADEAVVLRTRG